MTHPGIELCGATVRQAVTDGKAHARAILALDARYPADACTVIMDLTVEAEAFGARIVFPENEVPSVIEPPVHDPAGSTRCPCPGSTRPASPSTSKPTARWPGQSETSRFWQDASDLSRWPDDCSG